MKETIQETIREVPYSLHDSRLTKIKIEGNSLLLNFDGGFTKINTNGCKQVEGSLCVDGIDTEYGDFGCVYMLKYTDVLCGNYGHFNGEKIMLADFISANPEIAFDVMGERYGYHEFMLSGFYLEKDSIYECIIIIYHDGKIRYITEE